MMDDELVASISERYIELYEHITGEKFIRYEIQHIEERVENNINKALDRLLERG